MESSDDTCIGILQSVALLDHGSLRRAACRMRGYESRHSLV
jgi:hypothetical protein